MTREKSVVTAPTQIARAVAERATTQIGMDCPRSSWRRAVAMRIVPGTMAQHAAGKKSILFWKKGAMFSKINSKRPT